MSTVCIIRIFDVKNFNFTRFSRCFSLCEKFHLTYITFVSCKFYPLILIHGSRGYFKSFDYYSRTRWTDTEADTREKSP